MSKKTKKIIAAVIVAVVAVFVVFVVKTGTDKKIKEQNTSEQKTTIQETTELVLPTFEDPAEETDEDGLKDSDKETDYWDNVEVIEGEDSSKETVTNKNGEIITEEYPGKDEGWSPVISPDDL